MRTRVTTVPPARNSGRPAEPTKGPTGPFVLDRPGALRLTVAIAAAGLMAVLAVQLVRVDAPLGAPAGPDRLVAAIDDAPDGLPAGAVHHARQALQDRPIDGRAYRVLAQVATAEGDTVRAAQLYAIAAERWPRDRIAQAVLAEHALAAGDLDAGLVHLDALLRVAPGLRAAVLAQVAGLLEDAAFRKGLVTRVAQHPPWRDALVRALLAKDTPVEPALTFLDELADQQPLADGELQARITLLDRAGRPVEAREAWLQTLDPAARAADGLIFDGGFEHPDISGGYGWQITPLAGVAMGHDASDSLQGDLALAIVFDGRAVQFAHLQQSLALAPGNYRLQAASSNAVSTARPFEWRLSCINDNRALVVLPLAVRPDWQQVEAGFTVPDACNRQRLQLRHSARTLAERRLRGALKIDETYITRFP